MAFADRQDGQTIDQSESSVAVTGGGRLGGAIALDLAACGATVFALDLAVALERQRFGEGSVSAIVRSMPGRWSSGSSARSAPPASVA